MFKIFTRRLHGRTVISLDLEWYERTAGRHPTEVGVSIQSPDSKILPYHFIIEENQHFKNRHCPTSELGFILGNSEKLKLKDASVKLISLLKEDSVLVGHHPSKDKKILEDMFSIPVSQYEWFDTFTMYKKFKGAKSGKLETICQDLNIDVKPGSFHNAGNDAYYTLLIYNKLHNNNDK